VTYCIGIKVKAGLVFCSDSRTNAGVDQVHAYPKMYVFGVPGQCQFTLLSAGNLATTHGVVNQLRDDIDSSAPQHLYNTPSMHQTAEYIGRVSRAQQAKTGGGPMFNAEFILGGQILGRPTELFLIYTEGNYISVSELEPFLQIGESKYGKPILDRVINMDTDLQTCAKCALVSMDSTVRSNLTVGPPIDVRLYQADTLQLGEYHHYGNDSQYLRQINSIWHDLIMNAFRQLPQLGQG